MGTASWHPPGNLKDRVFEAPYEFELHQAIRLLDRFSAKGTKVRFEGDASLEFPASEIADISISSFFDEIRVRVRTQALVGALGVLPRWYSELILDRHKSRDTSLAQFLDLFVNRLVRLEYEACASVTPALIFERWAWKGEASQFTDFIRAALGIVPEAVGSIDERELQACGGVAARRPVSARVLEQIVGDRLAAPVTVRELTGGWYPVAPENRAQLGARRSASGLGETDVLGDMMLVPPAAITVEIGPISSERARDFWMDGSAERCRFLVAFLVGEALDPAIDLLVDSTETSGCALSSEEHHATHLGVNMWLHAPSQHSQARTRVWPRHKSGGHSNCEI